MVSSAKKLHSCSLDLVELERRRDFERRLGDLLEGELETEHSLIQRVGLCADMSKNRDLDIRSLPRRIESQRSVVSARLCLGYPPLPPQC